MGIGGLWVGGKMYFVSGAPTRKSRNLARNPACVISVSLKGLDLVIEGTAKKVIDGATLERLAKAYAAHGWPATVNGDAFTAPFSAPSAGPPPPHGASRWRF